MTNDARTKIYLPAMPNLPSDLWEIQQIISNARISLLKTLDESGFVVEHGLGIETWIKNLGAHTDKVDGMLFPPMSGLVDKKSATTIRAQRFFEAVSMLTGMHIGDHRAYNNRTGISKPCGFIDIGNEWEDLFVLLEDLYSKSAFSTKVEDIAFRVSQQEDESLESLNQRAVLALRERFEANKGKPRKEVHARCPDKQFTSFRKDFQRSEFGVIAFGSATMKSDTPERRVYFEQAHDFCKKVGQAGMRLITGAGIDSLMGEFDAGFHEGAEEFNQKNPDALYKPAHVGISLNEVLQLEGDPPHLDQLIVVPTRNERLRAFFEGRAHASLHERCSPSAKVACLFPGGIGSLEEFATMIQLKLNGSMMDNIEIHICNIDGYYDKLISVCEKLGVEHLFKVFPDEEQMMARVNEIHAEWLIQNPHFVSSSGGGLSEIRQAADLPVWML